MPKSVCQPALLSFFIQAAQISWDPSAASKLCRDLADSANKVAECTARLRAVYAVGADSMKAMHRKSVEILDNMIPHQNITFDDNIMT